MEPVARAFAHVANMLFPRGCAGCERPDAVLCPECHALFDGCLAQTLGTAEMGRWFACGWYRGAVRQAILSWKDHGDEECDRPFSEVLCSLAEQAGLPDHLGNVSREQVLIVPAPSSLASMRQRGRRHMMPLATGLASYLCARTGMHVRACEALENRGTAGRSVETGGTAQRSQRLKGRITTRGKILLKNKAVILVDDIVTSGTTMRRCVDVLSSQGAEVVTVLSLAHTPAGKPTKAGRHFSSEI